MPEAKKALDQILEGFFTPKEPQAFNHLIIKHLLDNDRLEKVDKLWLINP